MISCRERQGLSPAGTETDGADQANRLWPQRSALPPCVEQSIPECLVHLCFLSLGWKQSIEDWETYVKRTATKPEQLRA